MRRTNIQTGLLLAMALALFSYQSSAQTPAPGGTIVNRPMATPGGTAMTPEAAYWQQVRHMAGADWVQRIKTEGADLQGEVVIAHVVIAASGKVVSFKVIRGKGEKLAEISKQAVLACHFSPIPAELLHETKKRTTEGDLSFIVY